MRPTKNARRARHHASAESLRDEEAAVKDEGLEGLRCVALAKAEADGATRSRIIRHRLDLPWPGSGGQRLGEQRGPQVMEERMSSHHRRQQLVLFLVDVYTASGAVAGLGAILAATENNRPLSFILLFVAMVIDYTDGTLARALARKNAAARIVDGALLDHIVDFVTSAIAPAFLLWRSDLLPEPRLFWVSVMVLATAFKFSRTFKPWLRAGFFTGIPSPWIHLTFYATYLPLSKVGVGVGITALALLTVLPIGFLHIARRPQFRYLNIAALSFWWTIYLLIVMGVVDGWFWLAISFLQPGVYLMTSSALFMRHRRSIREGSLGESRHGLPLRLWRSESRARD